MSVKLTKAQYRYFASSLKTLAEGIILGVSAAFFLPETFQMRQHISFTRYVLFSCIGLIFILIGAILEKKGNKYDKF